MLLGGDELQRTQGGNNNAWCQDNAISWFDWELGDEQRAQAEVVRRLIALRREHPVFRRGRFFEGRGSAASGLPDVWWFRPDGRRMTRRDWEQPWANVVGVFLNGDEIADLDERGERIRDDSFLLLFNAHHEDVTFTLPSRRYGAIWAHELSTADPGLRADGERWVPRQELVVPSRSMVLLKRLK
jgi:glycogen operon protein